MARSAVLTGRTADLGRNVFVVILMMAVGFLVGWRLHRNFWCLLGAGLRPRGEVREAAAWLRSAGEFPRPCDGVLDYGVELRREITRVVRPAQAGDRDHPQRRGPLGSR